MAYRRAVELLLAAALLPAAGCMKRQVCAVLPVPPADSRSLRYELPLDPKRQDDLLADLAAGLNEANRKEHVAVDANARGVYGKLVERLGSPDRPTRQELTAPGFHPLLTGPVIRQVLDSRDPFTPGDLDAPIAISDGRYFWVFYPDKDDRIAAVMAVKVNACQNLKGARR